MATCALLGFLGGVLALVIRIAIRVKEISDLTKRELDHNHGGSIKDDTYGVAIAVGQLQRDRDASDHRVDTVLEVLAINHPANAKQYLELRRNHR
jgi:hypothetical protein